MINSKLRPVIEIYQENASFWAQERARGPFPEKKYLDWILGQLRQGDELLDIGCGSGFPMADYILKNGIGVTGVDAALSMIRLAGERLPKGNWVEEYGALLKNNGFEAVEFHPEDKEYGGHSIWLCRLN